MGAFRAAPRPVHRPRLARSRCWRRDWFVRNGDRIRIDIPNRSINVLVSDEELAQRRAWSRMPRAGKPAQPRPRKVSAALKAYAKLVMSADKGAVRDLSLLDD